MEILKKSFSSNALKKEPEPVTTKKLYNDNCKKLILKYEHVIGIETKASMEFEKIKQLLSALLCRYGKYISLVDKILVKEGVQPYINIKYFRIELWLFALCPETRIRNLLTACDTINSKKLTDKEFVEKEKYVEAMYPDVLNGIYRRPAGLGDIYYRKELDACSAFYEKIKKMFMSFR